MLPGGVPLADFYAHLTTLNGVEFPFAGEQRILYCVRSNNELTGMLLTARDQSRFCELASTDDAFTLNVRKLQGDNRLAEFNFFVINETKGRGLYQLYRGACGMSSFGKNLKNIYAHVVDMEREKEIAAAGGDAATKKSLRAIRSKFKLGLVFNPMFNQADFAALVAQMKSIRNLSYTATTFVAHEPLFTPATGEIQAQRLTVSFSKDGRLPTLRKTALDIAASLHTSDVAVGGIDAADQLVTYHVDRNLTSFGKCEFDEIATQEALDVTKIGSSPIVDRMRALIQQNPGYFS